jgi:hypothetical protein
MTRKLIGPPDVKLQTSAGVVALHLNPGVSSDPVGWIVDRFERVSTIAGDVGAHRIEETGEWILGGPFREPLPASVRTVRVRSTDVDLVASGNVKGWLVALPPHSHRHDLTLEWRHDDGAVVLTLEIGLLDLVRRSGPTRYGDVER